MAEGSRERVRRHREQLKRKSGGRTLSCWVNQDTARYIDRIKAMTARSNSDIVQDAVQELYSMVFTNTVATLTQEIITKQQGGVLQDTFLGETRTKVELLESYKKLLTVLLYNYNSENLKNALNVYGIPNLAGNSGTWKADQVRHLLKLCNM